MNTLIENLDYVVTDTGVLENRSIVIEGARITSIRPAGSGAGAGSSGVSDVSRTISGTGRAALAGLKNAHTHAAMTLLRGYGDDMRLQPWLENLIWPAEGKLTPEDVYWGTRLAAIEMIRSGTTFAHDMYFYPAEVVRAFRDSGMRAAVGLALFDFGDPENRRGQQKNVESFLREYGAAPPGAGDRVFLTMAPHSVYTCSPELLVWAAEVAEAQGLVYHTHMNETQQEVDQCLSAHGVRPFVHLDSIGVLERVGSRTVAAHTIWLDEAELDLVSGHGVTVVHNPASNMKLSSGCFPWKELHERGARMLLAPDGVASNNSLDMFDEMKLAALLQKHHYGDPTLLPAEETLAVATGARSTVFGSHGVGGALAEGGPADLVLVDVTAPRMTPSHNLVSNLVYAADSSVVDTVICDGELLMEHGSVAEEETVVAEASRCAAELVRRARSG
ncbi:MAG: amidohydrolase family protein [Spirochaetes bacterium]|jgi:5-methylthioadenosine/S-adenosylhomocysteine deaminase|nr:amidohydrolase family protein [Spirochaetota bacterium]